MATAQDHIDAIDAALLAFAQNGFVMEYQVMGNRVLRSEIPQMLKLRDYWQMRLSQSCGPRVNIGAPVFGGD